MENNTKQTINKNYTAPRIVYYILGILEILLGFRLIFKLLGANPDSGFVSFIYSLSRIFLYPFEAIFKTAATTGIETTSILEPATIIGMIVYAVIAWGIVKLIMILNKDDTEDLNI